MSDNTIKKDVLINAIRAEIGPGRPEFHPGQGDNLERILDQIPGDEIDLDTLDRYLKSPGFALVTTHDVAALANRLPTADTSNGVNLSSLKKGSATAKLATAVAGHVEGDEGRSKHVSRHELAVFLRFVDAMSTDLAAELDGQEKKVSSLPLVWRNFADNVYAFAKDKAKAAQAFNAAMPDEVFAAAWGGADLDYARGRGKRGNISAQDVREYRSWVKSQGEKLGALIAERGISFSALSADLRRIAKTIDAAAPSANLRGDGHLSNEEQAAFLDTLREKLEKGTIKNPESRNIAEAMLELDRLVGSVTEESAIAFEKLAKGPGLDGRTTELLTMVEEARARGAVATVLGLDNNSVGLRELEKVLTAKQLELAKNADRFGVEDGKVSVSELKGYLKWLSAKGESPVTHQEVAALRHRIGTFPSDFEPGSSESIRKQLHHPEADEPLVEEDVLAHMHTESASVPESVYTTVHVPGPYFTICHLTNKFHAPLAVTHVISGADLVYSDVMDLGQNRQDYFHPDERLPDFTGAPKNVFGKRGDQGHVFSYLDGVNVLAGFWSFVFTNMIPQPGELNRFSWKNLEVGVRDLIKATGGTAVVTSGGLYLTEGENGLRPMTEKELAQEVATRKREWTEYMQETAWKKLRGTKLAEAKKQFDRDFEENYAYPHPTHAYKTFVLRLPNGSLTTFSILLRNSNDIPTKASSEAYQDFTLEGIVSIDELERLSGIDYFGFLPGTDSEPGTEQLLEAGLGGQLPLTDEQRELLKSSPAVTILGQMEQLTPQTDAAVWGKKPKVDHALDQLATFFEWSQR